MIKETAKSVKQRAGQAAKQVVAGAPGPAARRWLPPLMLGALALFIINSALVISGITRTGFDVPLAQAVQRMPWGPLTYWMNLTNTTAGLAQDLFGAAVVIGLFIWERRLGYLMALGAISSLIDLIIKISVQRHRPTIDVVQILNPTTGYSYPSGHAVFFTWLFFMLAFALAPRVKPSWRWLVWTFAGVLIFLACVARVWAGAHWPTDVIGGFFEALAWCCFILWLPERWLPTPGWHWIRRGHGARKVVT